MCCRPVPSTIFTCHSIGKYSKMAAWLRMLVCSRKRQTSSTSNSSASASATVAGCSVSQNVFIPVVSFSWSISADFGAEEGVGHVGGPWSRDARRNARVPPDSLASITE